MTGAHLISFVFLTPRTAIDPRPVSASILVSQLRANAAGTRCPVFRRGLVQLINNEERPDIYSNYSKVTSQVIFKMMLEQGTNFIDMRTISRPQKVSMTYTQNALVCAKFVGYINMVQKFTNIEAYADECVFFWTIYNKANIFLSVI